LGARGFAERASEKGWDALTLFGCGLHRPLVHRAGAGLVGQIEIEVDIDLRREAGV